MSRPGDLEPGTAWIAEEEVLWVWPDGRQLPGRIAIGVPEDLSPRGARCATALDGLHKVIHIQGGSRLQALVLAIGFVEARLASFASKGGRVLDPAGEYDALTGMFDLIRPDPPE